MKLKIHLIFIAFFISFFAYLSESEAGKKQKKYTEQHVEDDGISKKSGCFSCFGGHFGRSKKKNKNEIDETFDASIVVSEPGPSSNSNLTPYNSNPPSYPPPNPKIIIDNSLIVSQMVFQNEIFKSHKCVQNCQQKVFVLALDGGGIRGVILARILMHIADMMEVPIYQLFNLMAGTSTGGLIALALSMPGDSNPELARFNPAEILNEYITKKDKIFKKRSIIHLPGIIESKYDTKGIETFCKETFSDTLRLSQLLVPAFVTTFNDTENREEIFGSHSAFLGDAKNKHVWKAGRMTSAAPYYFASVVEDGEVYRDGGLSSNNPSGIALDEILRLFPGKTYEDIIVVSIGTGEFKNEIAKVNLNLPQIKKIVKQFEQGQLAAVDRRMEHNLKGNYIRLQTELPCDPKTDDIDDDYIAMLLECANRTIDNNIAQFERLKSLWVAQHQETGVYKHISPYDGWQNIQHSMMETENMQSVDLIKIQEAFYKNTIQD